jgi:hypothetical protein
MPAQRKPKVTSCSIRHGRLGSEDDQFADGWGMSDLERGKVL